MTASTGTTGDSDGLIRHSRTENQQTVEAHAAAFRNWAMADDNRLSSWLITREEARALLAAPSSPEDTKPDEGETPFETPKLQDSERSLYGKNREFTPDGGGAK